MAKKLKDMTPFERVESRMKDLSWDEAEEVAIKILAKVVSKKVYVDDEGKEYVNGLVKRIMQEADQYAKENSLLLSFVKVFRDPKK